MLLFMFASLRSIAEGSSSNFYLGLFVFCAVVLAGVSVLSRAYSPARWIAARANVASVLIFVGHLASLSGAFLVFLYFDEPGVSGALPFVLLPLIAWAFLFYCIGIPASIYCLNRARVKE
jgi:hypothetical protein